MENQLITIPNDTVNVNVVKDLILEKLNEKNLISDNELSEFANNWHVIIVKKSWFKGVVDRLKLKKADDYYYKFVNFNFND